MIRKSIVLHCGPARAFQLFTQEAGAWWPPERRHTGDPESAIQMLESGSFIERARDGREVALGRVRVWEPPSRLVLDFYPGTDREHPTEVTVGFLAEGEQTRVTIDHGPLPVSEALWNLRNAQFDRSWDLVLAALARAL